jgi:GNAT superfamily N-acetyltransferase
VAAYLVREAAPEDAGAMSSIEARADAALVAVGVDLAALQAPTDGDEAGWTLAYLAVPRDAAGASAAPVGFARLTEITPELLCLDQVSVVPEHARRGVGRLLLERAVTEARAAGYRWLTGTTYRDVAFNGPMYRRLGAVEDDAPHPALLARRRVERSVGLDRFGERVVLRLAL